MEIKVRLLDQMLLWSFQYNWSNVLQSSIFIGWGFATVEDSKNGG